MKKLIYLITFCAFSILISSFKNADDATIGTIKLDFYNNAQISNFFPDIQDGDNIVFNRYYLKDDVKDVADDEYAENFYFEVPSGLESFDFHGDNLLGLNIHFKRSFFAFIQIL
ncbi:MAG: hypothetical protein ACJA08_001575 [Cyclobacteriaceae bacterium]|jgi:hypothetical protein